MIKTFLLLLLLSLSAFGETSVADMVEFLTSPGRVGSLGDGPSGCGPTEEELRQLPLDQIDVENLYKRVDLKLPERERELGTIQEGGEVVTATILSEEEADLLFQKFSQIPYMKFDYLHDGCFNRAHEFALIAKENGIEMGKAFIKYKDGYSQGSGLYPKEWESLDRVPVPSGFVGWKHHVAPMVLVRDQNGQVKPRILDVGVANSPKSPEQWRDSLAMTSIDKKDLSLNYRPPEFLYGDSRSTYFSSTIKGELRAQNCMREIGINEYIYLAYDMGYEDPCRP